MAHADYRDGYDDDCDGTILPILEEIVPQVAGAVPGYVETVLKRSIREFYRKSQAWRTFVDIGTLSQNLMPYEINPVEDRDIDASAVMQLAIDGWPLTQLAIGSRAMALAARTGAGVPRHFYTDPPTTIHFLHPLEVDVDNVVASVVVRPKMLTTELPQWCVDNHSEGFVATTLHKLHNEINKPYSDVSKAIYYGKLSRFNIQQAKATADKNYGTAEHDWIFPRHTR